MDDPTERDSMGQLTRSQPSSSKITTTPALNAKLLGSEFEKHADSEIVNRAIIRLIAVYGNPWGSDRSTAKVMAQEWEAALSDLPAIVVDEAVSEWVKAGSKWPRPADIRSIADRLLRAPIEAAARRHGMHPRRIEPAESMKGFLYVDSPLRSDPKWREWLDAQHPTLEHCFFRNARFISDRYQVCGFTPFEVDYLMHNQGRSLTEHFGRPIGLVVGPRPSGRTVWTDEPYHAPTPEERERVAANVFELFRKFQSSDAPAATSKRGAGANLDGASPEFRTLVGADPVADEFGGDDERN